MAEAQVVPKSFVQILSLTATTKESLKGGISSNSKELECVFDDKHWNMHPLIG